MAWTAASIVPSVGTIVTPRGQNRNQTRNQVMTGGAPVANMGGARPAFLNDPTAFLGTQFLPYADLLSRILTPQAAPSLPPALAEAYANQAQANTERIQMQNDATRAAMELPGQIAASRTRESAVAPWSLQGLPTGLGYTQSLDPLAAAQANTFNLRARQFGAPAISPINSGWLSPGLY